MIDERVRVLERHVAELRDENARLKRRADRSKTLHRLVDELVWIRRNTAAVAGERAAVEESWGNVFRLVEKAI